MLKHFIKKAQFDVQGPELQNVEHVVSLLRAKLSGRLKNSYSGASTRSATCIFFHVKHGGEQAHEKKLVLFMLLLCGW
jgi:hypothetical protein